MEIQRRTILGGMLLVPFASIRPAGAVACTDGDLLDAYLRESGFSGVAMARRHGRTAFGGAYGMAQRGVAPNTPRTLFNAASMGKMFTAVAIAQLAARRRLAFTDRVGRLLPGVFPAEVAATVTVHHLLTHTAGMGDVLARTPGSGPPPSDLAEMVRRIAATPLLFPPGTRFSYSNSGFVVLGAIIERLAGRPYAEHLASHVFGPAGMRHTAILAPYTPAAVPGMAHGYTADGRDTAGEVRIGNPSGGAITTAADMLAFADALTGNRLLPPALTALVTTGVVDTNRPGADDRYGYGFDDMRVNGVRIVGHNGGDPGYEAQLDIYPDRRYAVVMLANADRVLVPAIRYSQALETGATPGLRCRPASAGR